MGLDTLTFSFLFLPAVLLCFYLGPARWRNGVLVAASLFFYLCNAPEWLPMMLVSLLLDYLVCAKLVRSTVQMRGRRLVFWLSIIKNLLLMVLSLAMVELFALPLPLGVMVYTTTSMGYVIDVYNGDEYFDGKLIDFLMVTTFFGKLPAGPVVQYSDLKKQWQQREIGMDTLKQGMRLYIGGFAKLVILAQGNLAVKQSIEQMENATGTVLSVWILIITTTFGLYYTLTGYCDMARGLGCFFGLRFPENFHYPFQSRTVSDFFNRFNITVTQFINRYVYVFLGGDSNGVLSTIVNTLLTTMLMGLWFGIRLNTGVGHLFCCLYFAGALFPDALSGEDAADCGPHLHLHRGDVFLHHLFGSSLRVTAYYIKSMFGLNHLPFANSAVSYILTTNYLLLLCSFFCATSLSSLVGKFVHNKLPRLADLLGTVVYLAVFAAAVSFCV